MDYTALQNEILSGPLSATFAPFVAVGNDAAIADELNRVDAAHKVTRKLVESYEIINATDPADWAALSAAERQRYQTLTGAARVDLSSNNVRQAFAAMFGQGTSTRTAIVSLQERNGSRAEIVVGGPVTAADVAVALRG